MTSASPRRCVQCDERLPVGARSDAVFCSAACAARARRRRRAFDEYAAIHAALTGGERDRVAVRCPVCGRLFILGHPRRRDAVYDRDACRSAAYRARHGHGVPTRTRDG
ncbi:hypothetical protein [Embleya hyalina]|uniref:Uncharacterized protein n=1 Tax=Embleya hyalina TaxID=516124 RepID=A0A401Z3W7_9ACTN|nr:hypothetical protein [Embleya hyalina]GCE01538.1 hypothetical protein EHYA_09304 [Embleya hyalina]